MLIGVDGPAVVLDARTCAWLERYAGLTSLRVRVRGTDTAISRQLEEVRVAALAWRGSATGTEEAATAEPAASSDWLTTSAAADLLRITDRAVRKAIAGGGLQATKVGRSYRISREDVEHYRAARVA